MQADALAGRAEVADRAERVRADERARRRLPERYLSPPPTLSHRQDLERRIADRLPGAEVRHTEALRPRGAAALVAIEQLQHARRLAERAHALLELRHIDGVGQPDAALDDERVRRPAHELVLRPAEAALPLVNRFPLLRHAGP
jgi:hypothetical protein